MNLDALRAAGPRSRRSRCTARGGSAPGRRGSPRRGTSRRRRGRRSAGTPCARRRAARARRGSSPRTRSGPRARRRRRARPRPGRRRSEVVAIRWAMTSASVSEVKTAPSSVQALLQRHVVLDDAVDDDVDAVGGVVVRVGVLLGHAPVRGPARVPDAGGGAVRGRGHAAVAVGARASTACAARSRLPTARTDSIWPSAITEMPAES